MCSSRVFGCSSKDLRATPGGYMDQSCHINVWVGSRVTPPPHMYVWLLSHICMSHVTYVYESWHICIWVMSHKCVRWETSHAPHHHPRTESWRSVHSTRASRSDVWVMSHIGMSHVTCMYESRHIYVWVMSHIRMIHVAHMWYDPPPLRVTSGGYMCHICVWVMSHGTHMYDSWPIHVRVTWVSSWMMVGCDVAHDAYIYVTRLIHICDTTNTYM